MTRRWFLRTASAVTFVASVHLRGLLPEVRLPPDAMPTDTEIEQMIFDEMGRMCNEQWEDEIINGVPSAPEPPGWISESMQRLAVPPLQS